MTTMRALLMIGSLLLVNSRALAEIILFANMTNSQEMAVTVPTLVGGLPRPVSFGNATFILNDAMTALSFTATIFNIDITGSQTLDVNDNLGAAHIHASPTVVPGVNGPVVWGFFGSPLNDNNPNDVTLTALPGGAVGGTFTGKWDLAEGNNTTLTAQLANILGGHAYINFHTTQFGGGEIRGAIFTTPDSGASIVLLGLAAAGLIGVRRKLAR